MPWVELFPTKQFTSREYTGNKVRASLKKIQDKSKHKTLTILVGQDIASKLGWDENTKVTMFYDIGSPNQLLFKHSEKGWKVTNMNAKKSTSTKLFKIAPLWDESRIPIPQPDLQNSTIFVTHEIDQGGLKITFDKKRYKNLDVE